MRYFKLVVLLLLVFVTPLGGQTNAGMFQTNFSTSGSVLSPIFNPGGGSYVSAQVPTITSGTSGATICYTIDGSTPTATSPGTCLHGTTLTNGATITVSVSEIVEALATKSGLANSPVANTWYVISGGSETPFLSAYSYVPVINSVSSLNTNTSSGASGNLTVGSGDLLVVFAGGTVAPPWAFTSSPSNTWNNLTSEAHTSYEQGSYATASANSSVFNATVSYGASSNYAGAMALDYVCPSMACTYVAQFGNGLGSSTTVTITGITASVTNDGLLVIMCSNAGASQTWGAGTINGLPATLVASNTSTLGVGSMACEAKTFTSSLSNASASMTVTGGNNKAQTAVVFSY